MAFQAWEEFGPCGTPLYAWRGARLRFHGRHLGNHSLMVLRAWHQHSIGRKEKHK